MPEIRLVPAIHPEITATLPMPYLYGRQQQSLYDHYKGVTLAKTPEDLRVYQHVIWQTKPDTIVELGTYHGGSAMWFADQIRTLCGDPNPTVITVDLEPVSIPDPGVIVITGDLASVSPAVHATVFDRDSKRVMVIDDSGHTYQTTTNALRLYHDLVTPGCYFVVEDGCVDEPWHLPSFVGVVQPAIADFLGKHPEFTGHDYRPYGFGMYPNGWLERTR